MSPSDERRMLRLLGMIAASIGRLEIQLCGPRPAKPAPTAAELEGWAELNGSFGHIHPEPVDDGGDLPPGGGVDPATFFRRREPR